MQYHITNEKRNPRLHTLCQRGNERRIKRHMRKLGKDCPTVFYNVRNMDGSLAFYGMVKL